MNTLEARVQNIKSSGGVTLVDLEIGNHQLSALLIEVIDLPHWLKLDNIIHIIFKETEITLAKDFNGKISTRNKLPCKVINIKKGELISLVTLDFMGTTIYSANTTRAVDHLQLNTGDEVLALIKSNELTLMQKI